MNGHPVSDPEPAAIDTLIVCLDDLESLLQREYEAIRARDLELLGSVTRDKQTLVDQINRTASTLGDTLAEIVAEQASRSPSGQKIRALIGRCQQANKTNGGAIESSQAFTVSLLDVLRGRVPGERTYTARGRLGASSGSSAFLRA